MPQQIIKVLVIQHTIVAPAQSHPCLSYQPTYRSESTYQVQPQLIKIWLHNGVPHRRPSPEHHRPAFIVSAISPQAFPFLIFFSLIKRGAYPECSPTIFLMESVRKRSSIRSFALSLNHALPHSRLIIRKI